MKYNALNIGVPHNGTLRKTLLVMKLVIILIIASMLQVSAATFGQQLTLSGKNVTLKTLFKEIKKQTGYEVIYADKDLDDQATFEADFHNTPLGTVLNKALEKLPVSYVIEDKGIVIKLKEKSSVEKKETAAPPSTITGRVTNKQRQPLAGASILVKRTKTGTLADANGKFSIKGVNSTDTLLVSFIGYKTLKVAIGLETDFSLVLEDATNGLDQVVIQAYGTTTRRLATGDIGKVTAAEIEKQPVMNPLLALQGKVAGLDVTQTSGYASGPIKVELRGRSAINSTFTSDPLYVIDGVPLTVLEVGGTSNYQQGSSGFLQSGYFGPAGGQSPFFSFNPTDIESIEVLKDADATAIYGSRGANGVILITTKKGKAGNTTFNIHVQEGINRVTTFWQMMNTQQYLQMRREALRNDGITPSLANGDYDLLQWNTNSYTDWQKELYGNTGKTLDAQSDLSGGDANNTFRIGMGFNHTTNIQTVNGADQRGSLSFNLSHHSTNQRFGVSLTSGFTATQSNMVNLPSAVTLSPDAPPIYDSAGNLNYTGYGGNNTSARNAYPFANLLQPYISKTSFLNSNLTLNYQPAKGLRLSSSFGYNFSQANQEGYRLIASQDPLSNPTGRNHFGYNNSKNWIIEPQINYDALIGEGKISVLVGSSLQHTNTDGLLVTGYGYTSDELIKDISSAAGQSSQDNYGEYQYAAIFARATYNWRDKYILNLNARRDGSSRFGPGKQYGNFGSIGAAWIFTEEKWLKDHLSFLSLGKLRGSYGTTGSDAVGDYQYLTRWSANGTSGQPYAGVQPLVPQQHADPNFQWQVNKKLEAAIDLGFLKDRVTLSIDYYRDRVGNQLISFPLPEITGFTTVTANSPALVQNDGWEFLISAKVIDAKDFKWSMNFNMAVNHNKLLAYPNIAQSPYASSLIVGQPLNIVHLLHYTGVDPQTGTYTFQDKNHDGQIIYNPGQPADDTYSYDLSPKFFGGLGMNFSYRSLQLNLFFNFKKQIGINSFSYTGVPGVLAYGNQPLAILGHEWQKPGDVATYAKFTTQPSTSNSYFSYSDGIYTDASFIRLSNFSLSYNLPSAYIKSLGMQSCNVFVHSNNLFIITKYKGLDPEIQQFGSMPPTKTIVVGLSINF